MLKKFLALSTLALAPMTAFAGGSIDLFYIDNDAEAEIATAPQKFKFDGSGYGVRGKAELGNGFSMIAMHQSSKLKNDQLAGFIGGSQKLNETRIGLSYSHKLNDQFSVTGSLEHTNVGIDITKDLGVGATLNGYAATVGINTNVMANTNVYASIGYLNAGKLADKRVDGLEYTVGASYDVTKNFAGFVEYRLTDLERKAGGVAPFIGPVPKIELELDTLRIGGRYTF
ncbi:outer membrane protein [Perlucidibaca aquatica]|uniref:outer membrane protein n=1 Tax=Perlucidibaca aquatica TaxID=1852776 RepID=UPI00083AE04F|nr:outer membrane beta-barrel protein [Perlucidibaca aquatica]